MIQEAGNDNNSPDSDKESIKNSSEECEIVNKPTESVLSRYMNRNVIHQNHNFKNGIR